VIPLSLGGKEMSSGPLATPALAGIGIFGSTTLLVTLAFIYFLRETRHVAMHWSHSEYEIKMSRSIWLYCSSWTISFGATLLYTLQYLSYGFAPRADPAMIILWLRWLFYVLFFGVTLYMLANVMSHNNDNKNPNKHEPAGGDGQAMFSVLFGVLSALAIYGATVAPTIENSSVLAGTSVILFFVATALLYFPHDKIWGRQYLEVRDIVFSEHSTWEVMTHSVATKNRENAIVVWSFVYRYLLLVQWVVSYVGMVVIWFLGDGQFFTNTQLDLYQTVDGLLGFDCVFVVPFQLLLVVLTFMSVIKKVSAEHPVTHTVHFAGVHVPYDQL
jgi:hypothetical protein